MPSLQLHSGNLGSSAPSGEVMQKQRHQRKEEEEEEDLKRFQKFSDESMRVNQSSPWPTKQELLSMDVNVKQFPPCVTSIFFFLFSYAHKIVDLFSGDTRRRLLVGFYGGDSQRRCRAPPLWE